METLYKEIGMSRQALWHHKKKATENRALEDNIISIVQKWRKKHPRMGSRPLYHSIKNSGVDLEVGINKFEILIKNNELTVRPIKSRIPKTSDGKGRANYPNLSNGLVLTDINQLLVADITYYPVDGTWHYIFTLKDVYSQRVLSLVPSQNMFAQYAVQCIEEAVSLRKKPALKLCIHHSDNGSQYNADIFKTKLKTLDMIISRSQTCEQNGSSEQLNHLIKNMYFDGWGVTTFKELKEACKEFIYVNNNERAIEQLGNLSPMAFEKSIKNIQSDLRIKKILHDFETKK